MLKFEENVMRKLFIVSFEFEDNHNSILRTVGALYWNVSIISVSQSLQPLPPAVFCWA